MKIVVDARMREHGGIGTYLTQILSEAEKGGWGWVPLTFNTPIYSAKEQLALFWKAPRSDLFWSPHFNIPLLPLRSEALVVTIHDTYHLDHLDQFSTPKQLYAKLLFRAAVTRAQKIITVSQFSKSRLVHHFPQSAEKIEVIHSGCDHLPLQGKHPSWVPSAPFYLFVGHLKPHKNLRCVLQALQEHPLSHLVVVGQTSGFLHGVDLEKLKNEFPHLEKRVHFLGRISNDELSWLYQHAQGLIFPSLYEGWGLPPLEAMRLGCPVIASSAASIPEACGEAALYFDPRSFQELAARMDQLPRERAEWVQKGKARASAFSWAKTAQDHLAVFQKIY